MHTRAILRSLPVLLLLSACATAPAPSPAPAPAAAKNETPRVSLICHADAVAARFQELGVPREDTPTDVAISGDQVYVLFEPARLLRIARKEGKIQGEMTLGRPGETWTSMDVDPADGSLWLTSDQDLSLLRITPAWKAERVQLKKVEGAGGFQRIRVAKDAIYALPTCAEEAVWRIDRQGNVLATAFRAPADRTAEMPDQPRRLDDMKCSHVRLERDAEGNILAWEPITKKLHRADAQGSWTEVDGSLFTGLEGPQTEGTVVKGLNIGDKDEQWMVAGGARDLFYWKGRPAFLGSSTTRNVGGNETLILIPEGGDVREVVENCHGQWIRAIATTPTRYAAITGGFPGTGIIVLGDFASSPDLP